MKTRRILRNDQRGQALVEFALVAPVFMLIVAGVIQFGVALNYWLDMQRLANKGARWAMVNQWPGCPRGAAAGGCTSATPGAGNSLVAFIKSEAITTGLQSSVVVSVCYPDDGDATTQTGTVGTPVRVKLAAPFSFVPILKIGSITMDSAATMRLEQTPTHLGPPAPASC